jgi:hypothetical protein
LLVGIVDPADTFHIGHDQKVRLLGAAHDAQKQANPY